MSGGFRVLIFGLVLGALLAGAVAVGNAVGPIERGAVDGRAHVEGGAQAPADTPAEGSPAQDIPAGLSLAEGGLRLVPARTMLAPGRTQVYAFRVLDSSGRAVRAYDKLHERRMHVIVVRRDLTGFYHLHPILRSDGTWTTTVRLETPGTYRAFADFSTGGRRTVLGVDLAAPGVVVSGALAPPATRASAGGGYDVALAADSIAPGQPAMLSFRVRRDGRAAQVDPYLGARGHLVVLRQGDLGYLHTHSEDGALDFGTTFPSAGRYRAFLQFADEGRVRTAAFTLEVGR